MPAFRGLDAIASVFIAVKMRDTQSRARSHYGDCASLWQVRMRPREMQELFCRCTRGGMRDSGKIIHYRELSAAQLFFDQGRANNPWIVGEADQVLLYRPGHSHGDGRR